MICRLLLFWQDDYCTVRSNLDFSHRKSSFERSLHGPANLGFCEGCCDHVSGLPVYGCVHFMLFSQAAYGHTTHAQYVRRLCVVSMGLGEGVRAVQHIK